MKPDNKRRTRLYNLIFPIWLLLSPLILPISALFPFFLLVFLIALIGNFAIDTLVVWLSLRLQHITDAWQQTKKVIIKVWLYGFLADLLGAILMLGAAMATSDYDFHAALMYQSPFEYTPAALFALFCVIVTGLLIYRFNSRKALLDADIDDRTRRLTALTMAIITAPWTFLLPTRWFY